MHRIVNHWGTEDPFRAIRIVVEGDTGTSIVLVTMLRARLWPKDGSNDLVCVRVCVCARALLVQGTLCRQ